MIINKAQNIGTTFVGLICSAFKCDYGCVLVDPFMQSPEKGCGTIEVAGFAYDWFDRGDAIEFIEAN